MAEAEAFKTSKVFEGALGRRAGGGFLGNRRFLDLFHNYTSKEYAEQIEQMHSRLSAMVREIEGLHRDDDREYAQKSFRNFKQQASEFIKRVDGMSSFHEDIKNLVQRAKTNLEAGGKVNLEDQRAILGWLGRGNVGRKVNALQQNVKKYSKVAESLRLLLEEEEGKDHYDVMDELHRQLVEARGAYLDAHEKMEHAVQGKLKKEE